MRIVFFQMTVLLLALVLQKKVFTKKFFLAIFEMERTTIVPSFGLSLSSFDIKDGTGQRDNFLTAGGVEAARIVLQLSAWMQWK